MCESIANGGARCAAHAYLASEKAMQAVKDAFGEGAPSIDPLTAASVPHGLQGQWAGSMTDNYGMTVLHLDTPFETIDRVTGKPVEVTSIVDNNRGGYVGQNFAYFEVVGSKQKKDGSFYGKFRTLDVDIPQDVLDAFKDFNTIRNGGQPAQCGPISHSLEQSPDGLLELDPTDHGIPGAEVTVSRAPDGTLLATATTRTLPMLDNLERANIVASQHNESPRSWVRERENFIDAFHEHNGFTVDEEPGLDPQRAGRWASSRTLQVHATINEGANAQDVGQALRRRADFTAAAGARGDVNRLASFMVELDEHSLDMKRGYAEAIVSVDRLSWEDGDAQENREERSYGMLGDRDFTVDDTIGMERTARNFITENYTDIRELHDKHGVGMDQIGHDLWLTRNRHAAGFDDRGWGAAGERLAKNALKLGTVDTYVDDDMTIRLY